jgi:hypothetical protein
MKTDIFKKLIKEAVREAIQEEMKDLLLEAVRSNKQPVNESFNPETRTLNFNTNSLPSRSPMDTKKAYMDILGEMAQGPKSGLEGEFKLQGPIDPVNGSLPDGQLSLDQIMTLTKK